MRYPRSLCRNVGLVALAGLLACAFTPLPNALAGWLTSPARIEPTEAIVVLGSSIFPDGTLNATSLRRTIYAIRLYRRGLAPLLVFCGAPNPRGRTSEPAARAAIARDLGIDQSAVLMVTAWTTQEEAANAVTLLRSRGVGRILLVSESQHLRRAGPLFERAGFEVLLAPSDPTSSGGDPEWRLDLTRELLKELGARLLYRLQGGA